MSGSGRVTVADVAAASRVGVGTVSQVINGASGDREAARASVLRAIDQLGYRPSHLPAALSRGTPHAVIDGVSDGRLALDHLLRLGRRRIAFIGDRAQHAVAAALGLADSGRRLAGYRQALVAARLRPDRALIGTSTSVTGKPQRREDYEA